MSERTDIVMDESAIKRIMPHSTEAEQSVLGSMLIDNDTIQIAAEILPGCISL